MSSACEHERSRAGETQNHRMIGGFQVIISLVVVVSVVGVVGVGALSGMSGVAAADQPNEINEEVYTNDTLRLIAGGSPGDESVFENGTTIRGPLVEEPRRPLTVNQAVDRSAFVDGYRSQLDEEVQIPVEDEWILIDEVSPQRQWVVGMRGQPKQTTAHPDKSLTVEVEEDEFATDASVRGADVVYNETDDAFSVVNPHTAEVQNQSGAWKRYSRFTVVEKSFDGVEPINAASTEVDGQNIRVETSDSIGFMQVRNAQITWEETGVSNRIFDYGSVFEIVNENETVIHDGSYTTLESVNQAAVSGFEPDSTDKSRVPQIGDDDRWDVDDGAEVTLQSGGDHDVVRDHWTGIAHIDPGGKFEGEIDGEQQEFYIADPDGFRVYAPHDYRIVDPPTNDDGSTEEEWTREDVERSIEVTNGGETVSDGPWMDLSGGADGMEVTSTVNVTYTREWGSIGGELENSETVVVKSTQEVDLNLRASVDEPADVTVFVVGGGGPTDEIMYEIEGGTSIEDVPISQITVDPGDDSDLSHSVELPWQFISILEYDTVEDRSESGTESQLISLDPTASPWSPTTDQVAGGDIERDLFGNQMEADTNSETTEHGITLSDTVANSNQTFSVPSRFGSDGRALQRIGNIEELEDAEVEAETIFGTDVDGAGINTTNIEYIEYVNTNVRATYHADDQDDQETVQILLENEFGIPVSDRTLNISGAEEDTVITDEDGRAEVVPTGNSVSIVFEGDPPNATDDVLYAQSRTTAHDAEGVTRESDVFDAITVLMGMIVYLSPIFAFGIALVVWKIIFGRNQR